MARSLAALARSRIKTQSHQNSDPNGVDSLTRCARSLVWGSLRSPGTEVTGSLTRSARSFASGALRSPSQED